MSLILQLKDWNVVCMDETPFTALICAFLAKWNAPAGTVCTSIVINEVSFKGASSFSCGHKALVVQYCYNLKVFKILLQVLWRRSICSRIWKDNPFKQTLLSQHSFWKSCREKTEIRKQQQQQVLKGAFSDKSPFSELENINLFVFVFDPTDTTLV